MYFIFSNLGVLKLDIFKVSNDLQFANKYSISVTFSTLKFVKDKDFKFSQLLNILLIFFTFLVSNLSKLREDNL